MNRKFLLSLIMPFMASISIHAQDYSAQAKEYFKKFLTPKGRIDLIKHLPTLEECKMVFVGADAYTFYGAVEDMKKALAEESKRDTAAYVDISIESFSTQDIDLGKGNYAGGMTKVRQKLQPYIIFYRVNLLRTVGAQSGPGMKYWVCINGRWVYFPKIHGFY